MQSVLITGIAGGIGSALGRAYKAAGFQVIGTGRRQTGAESCDVFIPADLDRLAVDDAVLATFREAVMAAVGDKPLKALINNAATQILADTTRLTAADWQMTLNVNVTAPFRLVQTFLGELEQSRGSVLNIGSVHAQSTKPEFAAYATSKAALHGLTRALAVDLGGRIRVNCLAPAAISTPMLMAGFKGREDAFKNLEACHPVGRIGTPEECADAALFLTSDQAGFATGTVFYLDGGVLSRLHDPV